MNVLLAYLIGFDLHKYYCLQYIISITLYHMYFLKCFISVSFDYFCSSLYYIVSSWYYRWLHCVVCDLQLMYVQCAFCYIYICLQSLYLWSHDIISDTRDMAKFHKVHRRDRPSHDGAGRVGGVLKNAGHVRRGTKWWSLSIKFV